MRQTLLATMFLVAVSSLVARVEAQDTARIDLTGKWSFQVTTQAGSGEPMVMFKHAGDALTGHYSSANLGEADLTGAVKGRDVTFKFTGTVQGMSVEVTYTGTIESKDALKGTLDIGGLVQGTFTAKRQ